MKLSSIRHPRQIRPKQSPPRARVTLYTRANCHLCEDAKQAVHRSGCADHFTLEEIDIDTDQALVRRYGWEIPVVCIDGVETFKTRFAAEEFCREVLRAIRLQSVTDVQQRS
ncbi:MAG: glutaredoxin family protein [Acidobacteriota bacterium]|nr:glutaredoxin family protein [Acidobacteriota bacterium]